MLIMTSIIRVGQSKFVTVPIDEDSHERILNCIQTLSELEEKPSVHEIFLKDTKAAYSKMLGAQEVNAPEPFMVIIVADAFWVRQRPRSGRMRRVRRQSLCRLMTC